jgi:pseudouridine-5'-phosphate glycosidase
MHELRPALDLAHKDAQTEQVKGKPLTPFLLARLAEYTGGKSLILNQALLTQNAQLAAQVASALCSL